MTIRFNTVFGWKCGTATAPAALALAVALGVCERAAGQDVAEKQGEPTSSTVDVDPDWEIVEDYLERQKAWTEQVRRKVLAGVPDDLLSSGVGEKASSPQSRIVVIPASGDGLPSQAEMVEALREATEGRNSDGSLDAQLLDEGSRALVDELLRAAAGGQGDVKVMSLRSTDGESSPGAGETAADGRDRQGQASLDGAAPGQSEPPDIGRAAAAAVAILEQGGAHEKTVEAAEFLVNHAASASESGEYASIGTRALLEFAPDHQGWRFMLPRLHTVSRFGQDRGAAAAAVFEVLATEAEDPVLRAAGRYYVAAGRIQAANDGGLPEEERAAERQGALDAASGLSAGVEGELLLGGGLTLAEAEADLIRSIRHGTVGSKVPDLVGSRLDGVEERLSDYRGRVVLLDFWATWCLPCVAALPQKRQLVTDLPADRFALLSISVDAELETVTGFLEDEPMPWSNWHVGMRSDVTRTLNVNSYPTYILLDEQGEIVAISQQLPEDFVALIEATVGGAPEA
ncbi:MAG: TlpA disulfide reductase family protein [Acidobacteria bacterium]|nr:TlpA disulfide reductase family protein [Acidobacteriota bacterium]